MPMRSRSAVAAAVVFLMAAGCADSSGSDDLDRIDGPAQVDPDYRPLEDGSAPVTTDG